MAEYSETHRRNIARGIQEHYRRNPRTPADRILASTWLHRVADELAADATDNLTMAYLETEEQKAAAELDMYRALANMDHAEDDEIHRELRGDRG